MDSAAIEEANRELTAVIASTGGKRKRYLKLTDEQRTTIGRYASEHGTCSQRNSLFYRRFSTDSLKGVQLS